MKKKLYTYKCSPLLRCSNFRLVHIFPFLSPRYKNTEWEQDPVEPINQNRRHGECKTRRVVTGELVLAANVIGKTFHSPPMGYDLLLLLHQEACFHKTIYCKKNKHD